MGAAQVGLAQVGHTEVGALERGSAERYAVEAGPAEIRSIRVGLAQVGGIAESARPELTRRARGAGSFRKRGRVSCLQASSPGPLILRVTARIAHGLCPGDSPDLALPHAAVFSQPDATPT
jgi:hypothetical protein